MSIAGEAWDAVETVTWIDDNLSVCLILFKDGEFIFNGKYLTDDELDGLQEIVNRACALRWPEEE